MKRLAIFVLCFHYVLSEQPFPTVTSDPDIFEPSSDEEFGRAEVWANENTSQVNSARPTEVSTENWTYNNVSILMGIFSNESQSSESSSSVVVTEEVTSPSSVTPTNQKVNETTTVAEGDEEVEGVARGKPSSTENGNITTTSAPETIYQKTLALISDTYTLSIIVPIAAGIVFASTIILIIATCGCIRRRCRRRRLRRKALPDSVKNLRPSDRARLLAESSDEEF